MANGPPPGLEPGPVVDRGDAPELLADGYQGVILTNGVVKFNLISSRINAETDKAERVVVARLALPLPAFVSIYNAFGQLSQDMHRMGVLQIEERQDGNT